MLLVLTQADIVLLLSDFQTLSVQQNNLTSKVFPWKTNEPLFQQVINGRQRLPSVLELSPNLQGLYTAALQSIEFRFHQKAPVTSQAVLLRLVPVLPPGPVSSADSQLGAMLAQVSILPRLSADSNRSASETVRQFGPPESALMARRDPDPRPTRPGSADPRLDQRPHFQKPAKDYRTDASPDSRPPASWDRSRQDPAPSRQDPPSWDRSRQDQNRPRNDRRPAADSDRDDARILEIEDLQQKIQSLVAHLSNDRIRRHQANMAADAPADPDAVYTAVLHSNDDDADHEVYH